MDCSPPGSSVYGDSLGKNPGVGSHSILQGIEPRSPALQVDSLPQATREAWQVNRRFSTETARRIISTIQRLLILATGEMMGPKPQNSQKRNRWKMLAEQGDNTLLIHKGWNGSVSKPSLWKWSGSRKRRRPEVRKNRHPWYVGVS